MSFLMRGDMIVVAALGAFALWMRLKYGASIQHGIENLINDIMDDFSFRMFSQITFFVLFGAAVSVIMVGPTTLRQALAAGMSWTALLGGMTNAKQNARARSRKD